jgi:hypothetical protein
MTKVLNQWRRLKGEIEGKFRVDLRKSWKVELKILKSCCCLIWLQNVDYIVKAVLQSSQLKFFYKSRKSPLSCNSTLLFRLWFYMMMTTNPNHFYLHHLSADFLNLPTFQSLLNSNFQQILPLNHFQNINFLTKINNNQHQPSTRHRNHSVTPLCQPTNPSFSQTPSNPQSHEELHCNAS